MKAHIAVNAATGLTEKVVTIAANEHELNAADRLITAPVEVVFADAGYRGAKKRKSLLEQVKYWFIYPLLMKMLDFLSNEVHYSNYES